MIPRKRSFASIAVWLPVVAVIVGLFGMPTTSEAGTSSLVVQPSGTYGGQAVTFSGDMGVRQVQRIRLQHRGSVTASWEDVIDPRTGKLFSSSTQADGSCRFTFVSPTMNLVYFRVVSRYAQTPAHAFHTEHQEAEISVDESNPADVPLPRGFAVNGEPFWVAVDTAGTDANRRPVLEGRKVTLQRRVDGADGFPEWDSVPVATGEIGAGGRVRFGRYGGPADADAVAGVYRVRLERWTKDGDDVGWFPSLPFYLRLVNRPDPVTALSASPGSSVVHLSWALPGGPAPARIVIARTGATGEPTASNPGQVKAVLGGGATSHDDRDAIKPGNTYKYAVYTVSADGVYTRVPATTSTRTLSATREEQ